MKVILKQLFSLVGNRTRDNSNRFFLLLFFLGFSIISAGQVDSFRGVISIKSYDLDNDYNNSIIAQVNANSSEKSLAAFDTIYREYYVCNDTLVEKFSGVEKADYKLSIQYGEYDLIYIAGDHRFIKIKKNPSANFFLSDERVEWTRYNKFRKDHRENYNYFHQRKGDQKFKIFADVNEAKRYHNINYAGEFTNVFHDNGLYRQMIMYDGRTAVIRKYLYQEDENCDCSKFFDNLIVKDLTEESLDFLHKKKPSTDSIGAKAAILDASPFFHEGAMTFSGDTVRSLTEFEGNYVYVDLWASWCGPCRLEMPYLQKIKDHYDRNNIKILSISLDEQKSWESWVKSIDTLEMNWHNWIIPGGFYSNFSKEYKVQAIPRYLILNPEGEVIYTDAPRPSDEKIYDVLDKLLEE